MASSLRAFAAFLAEPALPWADTPHPKEIAVTVERHAIHHEIAHSLARDPLDVAFTATLADLGADSFDTISLALDLERAFDVDLREDEIVETSTVSEVIEIVQQAAARGEPVTL